MLLVYFLSQVIFLFLLFLGMVMTVCYILRDPGAVSWVDKMFVVILQ